MGKEKAKSEICNVEQKLATQSSNKLHSVVDKLVSSCQKDSCYNNVDLPPLPSMDALIEIIRQARDIIFPGYFNETRIDTCNLEYRSHIV